MKISILFTAIIILPFSIFGQSQFPDIEVTDLNDEVIQIPNDTKGKFTLIGIAFSQDAQNDLYSWSQPVFSEFMDKNNLSSLVYDPNVYLILLFGGANQLAYKTAKEQIDQGTDESLKDNVVLYKGKMVDYRKKLGLKSRKKPYFFVLDKSGEIIFRTEGRYTRDLIEKVGDLIEE
ncbi:MAG: hypothetical protein CMO34_06650 [Verrucomicrobia bacterium]|nr:hypothetical protein [Verrucomicrobiota bacterium]|tara:strand:+ start:714 stop:1241 length:528 start_codon:yes stop_codon:yes gene_type:complete